MSDNVVSLRGERFGDDTSERNGERALDVNSTLIKELERLLAAAKAGEIVGLAGAYAHRNHGVSYSYAGAVGGFAMLGGLECVRERLLRGAILEDA